MTGKSGQKPTGRPRKRTVEYFPHFTTHKKTITIMRQMYGNDGYACIFILLEVLGRTDGHYYDFSKKMDWLYLVSEFQVDEEKLEQMLGTLADLDFIDGKKLHVNVLWSSNFVMNLAPLYAKRTEDLPKSPTLCDINKRLKNDEKGVSTTGNMTFRVGNYTFRRHLITKERIGKERKGKDSTKTIVVSKNENDNVFIEIIDYLNLKSQKNFKPSSQNTRSLIKARMNEGFSVEDFKMVIDKKTEQWLNDGENNIYLRPQTLFRASKFEGYLNQHTNGGKTNEPITVKGKMAAELLRKRADKRSNALTGG